MKKTKVVIELTEAEYKKFKRLVVLACEKKIIPRYSGTALFKKLILEDGSKVLVDPQA